MANKTKYCCSRYRWTDTVYKLNSSLRSISSFHSHRNTYRSKPLNSFIVSCLTHVHFLSVTQTLFILFRLYPPETLSYRTSDGTKVPWKNLHSVLMHLHITHHGGSVWRSAGLSTSSTTLLGRDFDIEILWSHRLSFCYNTSPNTDTNNPTVNRRLHEKTQLHCHLNSVLLFEESNFRTTCA
jgi:hypothetical protein